MAASPSTSAPYPHDLPSGDAAQTLIDRFAPRRRDGSDQVLPARLEAVERERLRDLTLLGEYIAPPGESPS